MKSFNKVLGLFLSVVMVLSAFVAAPVSSFADETDPLTKGTFTIVTFDGYDPGELVYYYSDSYFSGSGKVVNPHLRTMSAALVFSLQGTSAVPDETHGKILRNIGFTDIETYDLDHTAMDSTGVVIARKTIGGKDVIAVGLRGDEYELEMASNLIADAQGDIRTFADAEARVENRVRAYLERHGITQAKYWVVGYSRSGAVVNLFGRELNRDLSGFCTTDDDIYVYAVGPAMGSADNTVYENIHNVIDPRDTITYVYPALWSLYGCGVPDYIGDTDETITLKSFSLFSDGYSRDMGEVKTSDFVKDFISFLGTNISRDTFYEKLQTPVSQILEIYFNLGPKQRSAFLGYCTQVFEELKKDSGRITAILGALVDPYSEKSAAAVTDLVIKCMDQVSERSGKPVSDDEYEIIKAAILPIVSVALPLAYKDFTATYDPGDGSASKSAPLYHSLTFFGNLSYMFRHHYNYKIFYELTALDSNYDEIVLLGDADGDGEISVSDATVIQRAAADIEVVSYVETAADTDEDTVITIMDATAVQRFLAGLSANESIGKPIKAS